MNNNNNFDFSNLLNNLNNGNIPDDLKNIINNFKNQTNSSNDQTTNSSSENPEINSEPASDQTQNSFNIDFDMLLKMKSIMDKMNQTKDDPRANLLLSLKPYLKESRKNKVEQYVKLFSMSKVMEVFNSKRR